MFAVMIFAATATAVVTPIAVVPAPPEPKMRCVREQVTGSLARSVKVCHTEVEWAAIRRDGNSEARRITRPGTMNDLNQ